jgi:hypothetical protein
MNIQDLSRSLRAFVGNFLWMIAAADLLLGVVWAGFWGIFYRKFFWDFVGGVLRDPGGIQCVY